MSVSKKRISPKRISADTLVSPPSVGLKLIFAALAIIDQVNNTVKIPGVNYQEDFWL